MIGESGIYAIPAEEYYADPCPQPSLSSSIARILIQDSPRHAREAHPRLNPNWVQPDSARHLDLGSLCHALILEGEDRAHVIDAENYRTKVAQEARDGARAQGLYPVLAHELPEIHAMMRSCREQILETDCPDAFTNGKPEQTLIWQESNGVWCRARLDWLMSESPRIFDYKTGKASMHPRDISRRAAQAGWAMQASFYKRGFKAVFGADLDPRFVFVCQENVAPFALSLMEVSPSDEAIADAQIENAIRVFGDCLKSGRWPGYSRHIERITSPPYYETSAMEDLQCQ